MSLPGSVRRRIGRSLKLKLALIFFGITAIAFSIIFFLVVPQLRSSLEAQKLDDLERVAVASRPVLEGVMGTDIRARELDELVRAVADGSDAQLTLLGARRSGPEGGAPTGFYVISDSRAGEPGAFDQSLARSAARRGGTERRATQVAGHPVALAAQPLRFRGRVDWVAQFSRSLDDVQDTVGLIRAQVLAATLLALAVALAGGYLVAHALARRVRRLDEAAAGVAAGRGGPPLPVESEDELGELTRTFNEMRLQLERVERARREFIQNASHELRTPIFSLGGFAELLEDEDLDEDTRREFVRSMREQIGRLGKLATDLLDLSRLDAGSIHLREEVCDVGDLARIVADEFGPALRTHGAELELELPDAAVDARCDPDRTAQILRILLDNSLRHTPPGTRVALAAERANGAVRVMVQDDGPGIGTEPSERVFERFFTAEGASGSGLGLAIARELAERMDGTVRLTTRPGCTEFTLELPPG